jgi:hypothetical protein
MGRAMTRRVSFFCEILFLVSSHISNIITTHKPAVSPGISWITSFVFSEIAWLIWFHSYLKLFIYSQASVITIVLELIILLERDWDRDESCMQEGCLMFRSHTFVFNPSKQREDIF